MQTSVYKQLAILVFRQQIANSVYYLIYDRMVKTLKANHRRTVGRIGRFQAQRGGHQELHRDADIGDNGSNVQMDTQEASVPQGNDCEEQGEEA